MTDTPGFARSASDLRQAIVAPVVATDLPTAAAQLHASSNTFDSGPVRFKYGPVYNAKAWGAVGDGVADDYLPLQAAATAAITNGGVLDFSAGIYKVGTSIDLSALRGTWKGMIVQGAGGGALGSHAGTTHFLNASGGPLFKAYGTDPTAINGNGSDRPITGITFRDFSIENTVNLGANYTIDLDYVTENICFDNVHLYGAGQLGVTGNGVRIRNFAYGQHDSRRLTVGYFNAGVGVRVASEVTNNVAVPPQSGNSTFTSCKTAQCLTHWQVANSGASSSINQITWVSCKAVNISTLTGSRGWHFVGSTGNRGHTLIAPHAEVCDTGYDVENGCIGIALISPLVSSPATNGIRIDGQWCYVIDPQVSGGTNGVLLDTNSSNCYLPNGAVALSPAPTNAVTNNGTNNLLPTIDAANQTPTLAGTWANYNTTTHYGARYWKDGAGYVHLSGKVKDGAVSSTVFTLAAGYRPSKIVDMPVSLDTGYGLVSVDTAGVVTVFGNNVVAGNWTSLEGVVFRTT